MVLTQRSSNRLGFAVAVQRGVRYIEGSWPDGTELNIMHRKDGLNMIAPCPVEERGSGRCRQSLAFVAIGYRAASCIIDEHTQ